MARLESSIVLLVALAAVIAFSAPVNAGRNVNVLRQPIDKLPHFRPFHFPRSFSILCIPDVSQILEDHEGRHSCAYNHSKGYRAVGVAYNLDDDVEQRKSEMSTLFADYDKVYSGDSCLNNIQITSLLALDATRALKRAEENFKPLSDFCCPVQAVFADIQHYSGGASDFPSSDMEQFIEKLGLKEYESAAKALKQTEWCGNEQNERRCDDNVEKVRKGC